MDIDENIKFPFYNAEFIRKGTRNVPVIFKDLDLDMGIDVALYPFDNVADKGIKRKWQLFSVFFWHKVRILRDIDNPVLAMDGWKKKVVLATCVVLNRLLRITHFSRKFINKRYLSAATRYNNIKTKSVSSFFATTPLECQIDLDELFPLQKKKFEYMYVNVPARNEALLTRMYGDYMTIPPKEKQKNHVSYILEFGEFDDIIVD